MRAWKRAQRRFHAPGNDHRLGVAHVDYQQDPHPIAGARRHVAVVSRHAGEKLGLPIHGNRNQVGVAEANEAERDSRDDGPRKHRLCAPNHSLAAALQRMESTAPPCAGVGKRSAARAEWTKEGVEARPRRLRDVMFLHAASAYQSAARREYDAL